MKKLPPERLAISFNDASSTGTGIRSPSISTRPYVVPKGNGRDRNALVLGLTGSGESAPRIVRVLGNGLLTVGQQHDARRWRLIAAAENSRQRVDRLQRGEDRFARRRSLTELEVVDSDLRRVTIRGGRHQNRSGSGKCDQPEVDAGSQTVGERLGSFLRCCQSRRLDVGGLHRQRHVDHEDHRGTVSRDLLVCRRTGKGDGEEHQRDDHQNRRNMAPPPGPRRRDLLQ